ncbi:MAG TPA: hypothetical protein VHP30_02565, partial [Ignavibacteriales bacterium]|nr:hypothetical protein [Ignavibacteriales bacterium]
MRLKITLFLLITAYFLTSGSLRAADITLNAGDFLISNSKPGKYEKLLNNSKVINFNLRGIKPILNKSSNLTIRDFPIDNKTAATISLKRMHSVVDENTRFITATKM